jgi:hypothetical protein
MYMYSSNNFVYLFNIVLFERGIISCISRLFIALDSLDTRFLTLKTMKGTSIEIQLSVDFAHPRLMISMG